MNKYTCFLILILAFNASTSFAQVSDSLQRIYDAQTIYRYGNKYVKGNDKLSYADLKTEFTSRITQELYKKSKTQLNLSRLFRVVSFGAVVASIFIKTDVRGAIQLAAGTGLLTFGAVHFQNKSLKYLAKAIWQRNREVLIGNTRY